MNIDIKFLKDLQEELNTQENDYQASPIFWVIRQKVKRVTDADFSDGQLYIYSDGDHREFETLEELRTFLEENEYDEELIEFVRESDDIYDAFEEILYNHNDNGYFSTYSYEDAYEIKENTMFLTKQEAKDHIKSNYYHYNDTVHTYAMTAWRAPKVERLLNILHKFDWESLEGK